MRRIGLAVAIWCAAATAFAGDEGPPSDAETLPKLQYSLRAPSGPVVAAKPAALPLRGDPQLKSNVALVIDAASGNSIYEKNGSEVMPIASITKLMTAMVVLDSGAPLDEPIRITGADVDKLKNSSSRLTVGLTLTRRDLLLLALMSSENRAASALGRAHPGGMPAFVAAMNRKAQSLGMTDTRFVEPTGLDSGNLSTARDLARLVHASGSYELIGEYSTMTQHAVAPSGHRHPLEFRNSNRLVANPDWTIGVSKTGYIREAGRCLVMQARVAGRQVIIVLLDSWGTLTRIGDANRIKRWMESNLPGGRVSG
jgi:D-alanyl-D-alanine endopeptidase (penicillin-binding protein 7)